MKDYSAIKDNIYDVWVITRKSDQEIMIKEEAGSKAVYVA